MLILGAVVHEKEHPRVPQTVDETVQHRLCLDIDPVEILDDETERLRDARGEKHLPQSIVRALAPLRGIDAEERVVRRQHTQQIEQRRDEHVRITGAGRQGSRDFLGDLGRRIGVLDVTEALQQFHEREIGRVRGIGRAAGGEDAPSVERADGVVHETRFAHTRLADDADDLALPLFGAGPGLMEHRELGSATDEPRRRDECLLVAQHDPRVAIFETLEDEASSNERNDGVRHDDRAGPIARHEVLENGPRRGLAVERDVERGALSSHDVAITVDAEDDAGVAAPRRAGTRRRVEHRQRRERRVARRVVDRLEPEDRHEPRRTRVFDAPAEALDLLRDRLQCARDVETRGRENAGAKEGEMAALPLGGDRRLDGRRLA